MSVWGQANVLHQELREQQVRAAREEARSNSPEADAWSRSQLGVIVEAEKLADATNEKDAAPLPKE
jgi:hypothetical protein